MPFTVDIEAMTADPVRNPDKKVLVAMDLAKPPVKQIPHLEFPRVVYMHPKERYRKIEHRNALHELVDIEMVPAEHIARVVADKRELEQALKDGWQKEPFVFQADPDPNAGLYESK
jgi:hypothetical protein